MVWALWLSYIPSFRFPSSIKLTLTATTVCYLDEMTAILNDAILPDFIWLVWPHLYCKVNHRSKAHPTEYRFLEYIFFLIWLAFTRQSRHSPTWGNFESKVLWIWNTTYSAFLSVYWADFKSIISKKVHWVLFEVAKVTMSEWKKKRYFIMLTFNLCIHLI